MKKEKVTSWNRSGDYYVQSTCAATEPLTSRDSMLLIPEILGILINIMVFIMYNIQIIFILVFLWIVECVMDVTSPILPVED